MNYVTEALRRNEFNSKHLKSDIGENLFLIILTLNHIF